MNSTKWWIIINTKWKEVNNARGVNAPKRTVEGKEGGRNTGAMSLQQHNAKEQKSRDSHLSMHEDNDGNR